MCYSVDLLGAGLRPDHRTFKFFTDSSRMVEGVEAVILYQVLGIATKYKLRDYCIIFQAEGMATKMAVDLYFVPQTNWSYVNFSVDS